MKIILNMLRRIGCSCTKIRTCNIPLLNTSPRLRNITPLRHLASVKRFYRKTDILSNDGRFEITLDQRKLKTPKGNLFYVHSEPLALAVAAEWDSQKTHIIPSSMHLTGLCSTVIDNPNKFTKEDIVMELINYLEMDTILFYTQETDELFDYQKTHWTPVISWFSRKFDVDLQPVRGIEQPILPADAVHKIEKYLMSHNDWAIHGFKFIIEALKSVILGISCCERYISVEKAVSLARLEEEYQGKRWGRIEWCHEMNQQDLQARVAAGVLFIHANTSSVLVKKKGRAV